MVSNILARTIVAANRAIFTPLVCSPNRPIPSVFLPSVTLRDVFPTRHFPFSPSVLLLQARKSLGATPAKGDFCHPSSMRSAGVALLRPPWLAGGGRLVRKRDHLDLLLRLAACFAHAERRDKRCGAGCSIRKMRFDFRSKTTDCSMYRRIEGGRSTSYFGWK
jgi:hypothetical protein